MPLPPLRLKKNEDRRLRAGHLWVFSNEVDTRLTPLASFTPGDAVEVTDSRGRVIGSAYVNPNALICARLISRRARQILDRPLLMTRLQRALALRTRSFEKPYYRLVYGEGDALPGLIVDRYGDVLVVQFTTAGMERVKNDIIQALVEALQPKAILLRNDSSMRALEGLERTIEPAYGNVPERVMLEENGARFEAPLLTGQKTGWFYDHRLNRARVQHYARGKRVLDVFSYLGAFGIQAALGGAREVLCVDSSEQALEFVKRNAALNGVTERVATLHSDAFDALKSLHAQGERYDVVILDPPAFIKRKKDMAAGVAAYQRLTQLALQLLTDDGLLLSASCSFHLARAELRDILRKSAVEQDCQLQIIEQGHQGPDHPVHPAIPETDYLKAFLARIQMDT
ncbi:MAG: class I SAM-dependent rRNA methyltransferase [Gammaproteobacteria bacterium]|nr:class I SAM-dependent rRNA methyltransferase [Gammaproteobacteria bacterium]